MNQQSQIAGIGRLEPEKIKGQFSCKFLPLGRLVTEEDAPDARGFGAVRGAAEEVALSFATRGVRVSVVRPAPSVHGNGDKHGFAPALISIARAKGVSSYPGDGSNRWTAVHRLDLAHLFRLALETAPAGTRLHGSATRACRFATSDGI